jgi:DNA-binding protein HU-beta
VNKAELIEELADRLDGNRRAAGHALESVLDVIQRAMVKGEKVVITGFGSFEAVARGARTARNPRTGETVKVKKTTVPKFKAGADLKAVVSGAKKLPKVASSAAPAKKAPAKKTAKKTARKR